MTPAPDSCDLLCLDAAKAEAARAALPATEEIVRQAAAAKALGDPTRLTIAHALYAAGSACGCDLAFVVGRDDKLVSHHLRSLRSAGLAASTREGKMVIYELTERGRRYVETLSRPAVVA